MRPRANSQGQGNRARQEPHVRQVERSPPRPRTGSDRSRSDGNLRPSRLFYSVFVLLFYLVDGLASGDRLRTLWSRGRTPLSLAHSRFYELTDRSNDDTDSQDELVEVLDSARPEALVADQGARPKSAAVENALALASEQRATGFQSLHERLKLTTAPKKPTLEQ